MNKPRRIRIRQAQTATCPTCRQNVKLSRWTGRIGLHVGTAIGDHVFCETGRFGTRGGAA